MREVKFRAWDTSENKMHTEISLLFANDLNGVFEGLIECGCIAMQYTGLKDKNGTEIYEGDILQQGKRRFIVAWNNDIGSWFNKPTDDAWTHPCFNIGTVKNLKIVGNIHENPELLEVLHEQRVLYGL